MLPLTNRSVTSQLCGAGGAREKEGGGAGDGAGCCSFSLLSHMKRKKVLGRVGKLDMKNALN